MGLWGLAFGEAFPVFLLVVGLIYSLFFDPKSKFPRGDFRRLR